MKYFWSNNQGIKLGDFCENSQVIRLKWLCQMRVFIKTIYGNMTFWKSFFFRIKKKLDIRHPLSDASNKKGIFLVSLKRCSSYAMWSSYVLRTRYSFEMLVENAHFEHLVGRLDISFSLADISQQLRLDCSIAHTKWPQLYWIN